jgi:hypothetical protein
MIAAAKASAAAEFILEAGRARANLEIEMQALAA